MIGRAIDGYMNAMSAVGIGILTTTCVMRTTRRVLYCKETRKEIVNKLEWIKQMEDRDRQTGFSSLFMIYGLEEDKIMWLRRAQKYKVPIDESLLTDHRQEMLKWSFPNPFDPYDY